MPAADERSFSYWNYTSPTFGDLDGDGDFDLVVGGHGIRVSENIGNKRTPWFAKRKLLKTPNGEPLRVRCERHNCHRVGARELDGGFAQASLITDVIDDYRNHRYRVERFRDSAIRRFHVWGQCRGDTRSRVTLG